MALTRQERLKQRPLAYSACTLSQEDIDLWQQKFERQKSTILKVKIQNEQKRIAQMKRANDMLSALGKMRESRVHCGMSVTSGPDLD